jgi:hypothetical protein
VSDTEFAERLARVVAEAARRLPAHEVDQLDAMLRDRVPWRITPTPVDLGEGFVTVAVLVSIGDADLALVNPSMLGLSFEPGGADDAQP